MPKLLTPKDSPGKKEQYTALSSNTRMPYMIFLGLIIIVAAVWFISEVRFFIADGITALQRLNFWIPSIMLVLTGMEFRHGFKQAKVEYSMTNLRVTIKGKTYQIPFTDIEFAKDAKDTLHDPLARRAHRIFVHLNKTYPFGNSFNFSTPRDYHGLEGTSPPTKLINNFADKAQGRQH